jgi:hypothetical protein
MVSDEMKVLNSNKQKITNTEMKKIFLSMMVMAALVAGCSKKEDTPGGSNGLAGNYKVISYEAEQNDTSEVNENGINSITIVNYKTTGSTFAGVLNVDGQVMRSTVLNYADKTVRTYRSTNRNTGVTTTIKDSTLYPFETYPLTPYTLEANGKIYIAQPTAVLFVPLDTYNPDRKFDYTFANGQLTLVNDFSRNFTPRPTSSQRSRYVSRIVYQKQ